jgi:hypothetical protein
MAKRLFKTDFEAVTRIDSTHLNLGKDINKVTIQQYFETDGHASEINWIEGLEQNNGITPHSGTRCLGMKTGGPLGAGKRNEFNLMQMADRFGGVLYGKEIYYRIWCFIPLGTVVPPENADSGWLSLGDPFQSSDENIYPPSLHPYCPIVEYGWDYDSEHDGIRYGWGSWFSLGDPDYMQTWLITDTLPPLGRWFKIESWVYYHQTAGQVKFWVDGDLLLTKTNVRTMNQSNQPMLCSCAKNYRSLSTVLVNLYFDDLEMWDGIPTAREIQDWNADVNNDGWIDALDWAALSSSYGLHKGETGYDSRADISEDDFVDINDAYYIAQNVIDPATGHYGRRLW